MRSTSLEDHGTYAYRSIKHEWQQIRSQSAFFDVEIKVNSDQHIIGAHYFLVNHRCPKLASVLRQNVVAPTKDEASTEPIYHYTLVDPHFTYEEMDLFIDYVYSELCDFDQMKVETIFRLGKLAAKFDFEDLETKCNNYFITSLSIENVCKVLVFADCYGLRDLRHHALKFVKENFAKLTEELKTLTPHGNLLLDGKISMNFLYSSLLVGALPIRFYVDRVPRTR